MKTVIITLIAIACSFGQQTYWSSDQWETTINLTDGWTFEQPVQNLNSVNFDFNHPNFITPVSFTIIEEQSTRIAGWVSAGEHYNVLSTMSDIALENDEELPSYIIQDDGKEKASVALLKNDCSITYTIYMDVIIHELIFISDRSDCIDNLTMISQVADMITFKTPGSKVTANKGEKNLLEKTLIDALGRKRSNHPQILLPFGDEKN